MFVSGAPANKVPHLLHACKHACVAVEQSVMGKMVEEKKKRKKEKEREREREREREKERAVFPLNCCLR
jgi:hypothetical protein